MKTIFLILVTLIFVSCITPSRLGMNYKGQQIVYSSNKIIENPNINISVNSLTKEDNGYDIKRLNYRFISYIYKNEILAKLIQEYPDTKIEMEVTPSEDIKRTWILDILFFYPGEGWIIPYTPWWGTINLDAKLLVTVPKIINTDFKLNSVEPFKINLYPYYRAGRILTEKYSVAYNNLLEQISKQDFDGKFALLIKNSIHNDVSAVGSKITSNSSNTNEGIYSFNRKSDVDIDIPELGSLNQNRFALIIGNEDYSSQQAELATEANVDFARNDASAFKEYATKALGIPKENITFILDGTTGKMKQAINKMSLLAKNSFGNAEIFFYYAGHGLPDEIDKEPYIIPVDVSGNNITEGIKLMDVYKKLTEFPCKSITVFLDACFSGGARSQGLFAARGVKVKPKEDLLKGNLVVFTASSGEQSSLAYKEKEHGLFTYYLLQKFKESKGNISYKDLSTYLSQQVGLKSVLINNKEQNPQTNVSLDVQNQWQDWKFK